LLLEAAVKDDDFSVGETQLQELARLTATPNEAKATIKHLTHILQLQTPWRSVYKALHITEFLLEQGSEELQREVLAMGAEVGVLCEGEREEGEGYIVRMKAKLVYQCICERIRLDWKSREKEFYIEKSSVFERNRDEMRPSSVMPQKPITTIAEEPKPAAKLDPSPLFIRLHKCKSTPSQAFPPSSTDLLHLNTPELPPAAPIPAYDLPVFDPVPAAPQKPSMPLPLPRISHNMPASEASIPAVLPVLPVLPPAKTDLLDMKSLLSGLDSLKDEVEAKRRVNRKREIVINL
jgi:hypothetical protein